MSHKIKLDPHSNWFTEIFNELFEVQFSDDEVREYVHSYYSLLDAYINFNERSVIINHYNAVDKFDTNLNKINSLDEKTKPFKKTYGSLAIESDKKLILIRNALTHNFWMYFSNEEFKILNKKIDFSGYVSSFLKESSPKEIYLLLESRKTNDGILQVEKWKKDFEEKIHSKNIKFDYEKLNISNKD